MNPSDQALIGRAVSFYLVNQYGRIEAAETTDFVGLFDFYTLDLTFNQPLPVATPTPTATPIPTVTPTASLPRAWRPVGNRHTKTGFDYRGGCRGWRNRAGPLGPPQGRGLTGLGIGGQQHYPHVCGQVGGGSDQPGLGLDLAQSHPPQKDIHIL